MYYSFFFFYAIVLFFFFNFACFSVDHHCTCSVAQSCSTLCKPMDCSLPGSSVYGILQARILEWVVISFSLGSSQPRDKTCISEHLLHQQVGSLPLASPGKPTNGIHDFVLFWLNSSPLCTYTSLKPIDF